MERVPTRINSETREETNSGTDPVFRYRTSLFDLDQVPGAAIAWHWHTEVECFCVRQGELVYHLQSGEFRFQAGDVGFVNSGVLHMVSLPSETSCLLQNHIFLPRMICGDSSHMESRYVTPVVRNTAAPLLRFPAGSGEAAQILRWMDEAHQAHVQEVFGSELIVRDCMSRIWMLFAAHMPELTDNTSSRDSQRLMTMLRYIGEHYAEKLDLQSLAAAAHISSKECERCFQKQIKMAPFDYIMEYRLEKARILLQQREGRSITEIGQRCGFATTSYFGKCFREKYGMSPREYSADF